MSVRRAASHEVRAPRSIANTLGTRLMTNAANVTIVAVCALMCVSRDIDRKKKRTNGVDGKTTRPGGPDGDRPTGRLGGEGVCMA